MGNNMKAAVLFLAMGCRTQYQEDPVEPEYPEPTRCEKILVAIEEVDASLWESYYRNGCAIDYDEPIDE